MYSLPLGDGTVYMHVCDMMIYALLRDDIQRVALMISTSAT